MEIKKPNIVLIDGHALMYRSYYAVQFRPMHEGVPLNIVHGFWSTFLQSLRHFDPERIIVTFDTPEPTFRHVADKEYKAQRAETPDDFYPQVPYLEGLLEAFNIPVIKAPGFEADDILGTLAVEAEQKKLNTYILSGDLDLLQLITDKIYLAKFDGKTPYIFDREETIKKLGVPPEQVIDYKAICGDSSDNYKGVPGVGPKGALNLLTTHQTLEDIYAGIDDLPEKLKTKFNDHKDLAFHCQHLAQIKTDVPLEHKIEKHLEKELNWKNGLQYLTDINFNRLYNQTKKMNNYIDQGFNFDQKINTEKIPKNESEDSQMALF